MDVAGQAHLTVSVPAGTVLFRPGDPCTGWLRVRKGSLRVSLVSALGRELVLYRVGPGDVCLQTLSCLVQGTVYTAEGVAETDLRAELVPAGRFPAVLEQPHLCQELLGGVARRFGQLERLVSAFAFAGLDTRLASALLALAGPDGQVEATQDQLAAEAGSAREAVSRKLSAFAAEGLVVVGRGHVSIVDTEGLRRRAAGPDAA
jgi:CRP/FNR family transcriptional regulator, anaerobic regulatory protein